MIPTDLYCIEQVLSLLHEALSQSGDHYSIEYDGRSAGGGTLPPLFRRLAPSLPSSTTDGEGSLGSFKRQLDDTCPSSANKRRRHSDSGNIAQDVLLLALPSPRGNMKGSLSLEGEPQQSSPTGSLSSITAAVAAEEEPSSSSLESPASDRSPMAPIKDSASDRSTDGSSGVPCGARAEQWARRDDSRDSESSSVFGDDLETNSMFRSPSVTSSNNSPSYKTSGVATNNVPDNCNSVADDDPASGTNGGSLSCSVLRDVSVVGGGEDKTCRRRRLWYRHHHFSTPVSEDISNHNTTQNKHEVVGRPPHQRLSLRSSSLPDPHTLPLAPLDCRVSRPPQSPLTLLPPPIPCHSPPLPLITVSSPTGSDVSSHEAVNGGEESCQTQNGSNTLPPTNILHDASHTMSSRPSVIQSALGSPPPTPTGDAPSNFHLPDPSNIQYSPKCESSSPPPGGRSSCLKTARRTAPDRLEVVSLEQQQQI